MYNIFKFNTQIKFVYTLFINEYSLQSLIKQQYEMSKRGISLTESDNLPLFEFDAYSSLSLKDAQRDAEQLSNINPLK